MADKSPTGSRDMGGGSLVRGGRDWDEGAPKDFRGEIHPAPKMHVAHGSGPKTGLGDTATIAVKSTQSAPAPRMDVASKGPRGGGGGGKDYHSLQRGGGTDKGPRGSGKSGGAGVTS